MRWVWAWAATALLLGSLLLAATALAEPSLVLGVLAAVLVLWAAVHGRPALRGSADPATAGCRYRRALARRAVPRQRDPDAAGHTRSRAPSGLLPAA